MPVQENALPGGIPLKAKATKKAATPAAQGAPGKAGQLALVLARADIFFYALLWLMVLLVIGTIAQKDMGLYAAHHKYFASFVVWFGPLPLPGGYPTMGVVFVNLLAKLLFASPWSRQQAGNIITHLGALLLLFGGFLTAAFSEEGNMVLAEGERSAYVSDYHKRELVVASSTGEGSAKTLATIDWDDLATGQPINNAALPFTITVRETCRNCVATENTQTDETRLGAAQKFRLEPRPDEIENEANLSGVTFSVTGADEQSNGIHFASEAFPMPAIIHDGGAKYVLLMRKARRDLPFAIELVDFEKKSHPGTGIAKSYKSEVRLIDGDAEWHSTISMNEPLRYKGYTFFQSSFLREGENEYTVLAVVKNAGRLFPYIASIVMCIGLLIHLFLRLPRLMRKS